MDFRAQLQSRNSWSSFAGWAERGTLQGAGAYTAPCWGHQSFIPHQSFPRHFRRHASLKQPWEALHPRQQAQGRSLGCDSRAGVATSVCMWRKAKLELARPALGASDVGSCWAEVRLAHGSVCHTPFCALLHLSADKIRNLCHRARVHQPDRPLLPRVPRVPRTAGAAPYFSI